MIIFEEFFETSDFLMTSVFIQIPATIFSKKSLCINGCEGGQGGEGEINDDY